MISMIKWQSQSYSAEILSKPELNKKGYQLATPMKHLHTLLDQLDTLINQSL